MSARVNITGNLSRDPELRFTPAGKAVVGFSVVTSRSVKNQDTGQWDNQDVTFWDCSAFEKLAENVVESCTKGTRVTVMGNLKQQTWKDKQGNDRTGMKLLADDVAVSVKFKAVKVETEAVVPDEEPPF